MNALAELLHKLQETETAISRSEAAIGRNPESDALKLSFRSFLKRQGELKKEFLELTKREQLDICSYRIFPETKETVKISAFAGTLSTFQSMFTIVYDALKNGPKERARVDPATAAMTAFDFGYCFMGSVGIMMTMPTERMLFGESDLDRTASAIFSMAKTNDSAQIASFAKQLGVASVRKMYEWATGHHHAGAGAEIEWRNAQEVKYHLMIQLPEIEELRVAIEQTGEEVEDTIELVGTLVGADVEMKRFHMTFPDAEDIKGEISPLIGTRQTLEIPKRYTVDILKRRKIKYSTETEEVSYVLLKVK